MNAEAGGVAIHAQLDPGNPWPGLASYEESSQAFFSGREGEIGELVRRVTDDPVTVLFGKSGLGKTSLLKAGLFPRLRDRNLLPLYIRLQIRPDAPALIAQVKQALADELRVQRVDHPPFTDGESPWEYLHRTGLELWSSKNRLLRPVFVFDQFEEVFTLGRAAPREVERFRLELADLAENRVPPEVAERLERAAYGEAALDFQAMPYKLVVSMREDFLADLEGWRASMPSLRRNRMRLMPMGPDQALEAVWNEHTRHLVDEAQAQKIVAFLSSGTLAREASEAAVAGDEPGAAAKGATVEPALLSLFCRGVNEQRKRQGKAKFDDALLEGGKETIVADFYRDALADQPAAARRFVEEQLVTEHGYRNSYSVDDALAHGYLDAKALDSLVDRRLLRRDYYLGTERVELTHDLLTRAVVEERDRRREAERRDREARRRRRSRLAVGMSIGVAIACGGLAVWAFHQSYEARRLANQLKQTVEDLKASEQAKVAAAEEADRRRGEAEKAKGIADEASQEASRAAAEADTQRQTAEMREISTHAQAEKERDPRLAILLALEAKRRSDAPEARSALLDAARFAWPAIRLPGLQAGGTPVSVALSPDGRRLAVASDKHLVSIWDVDGRELRQLWRWAGPASDKFVLGFSPDGERLAVGTDKGVQLLGAASGEPLGDTALPGPTAGLTFSPDGRTLAIGVTGNGVLAWESGAPPKALQLQGKEFKPSGSLEVRFGSDARSLSVVSTDPLQFAHWKQGPDDRWKSQPVDLGECATPESVSASSGGASVSYLSFACLYYVRENGELGFQKIGARDRLIKDIVWSRGGRAYVEVLESPELLVRRPGSRRSLDPELMMESRIKGARLERSGPDNTFRVSISDDGRRLAAIEGPEQDVTVYALDDRKIFLTQMETEGVAVSPDGRWVGLARTGPGPAPGTRATRVRLVPLDDAVTGSARGRRPRHTVPGELTLLIATPGTLLVATRSGPDGAQQLVGLDRKTGRPWAREVQVAQNTRLLALGANRQIVHVVTPRSSGRRLGVSFLRASDGETVMEAQPDDRVVLSRQHGAVLVCRNRADAKDRCDAEVFAVEGQRLVSRGSVAGLARNSALESAEDGRILIELRRGNPAVAIAWRVAPVAGMPARVAWSSTDHLESGGQVSGVPRMLDAEHLAASYRAGSRESRAAVFRLGGDGQRPIMVWSGPADPGKSLDILDPESRLLDRNRLVVKAASDENERFEIHRLDSGRPLPPQTLRTVSPKGRYVVSRGAGAQPGSGQLVVTRSGSTEALIRIPPAEYVYEKFSPDDRWLAVLSRGDVDLFDLASGRLVASFEKAGISGIDFSGGSRVAQLHLTNGATMLIPLDPVLVEQFARSLVGDRKLSTEERCLYLPERSGCTVSAKASGAGRVEQSAQDEKKSAR